MVWDGSERMATTAKKKTKIEIEKNEDPQEDTVLMMAIDDDAPEVKIDELPGVGPATAEKLREAGFDDLLSLAVMSPADLAEQAEMGEAVAGKIIASNIAANLDRTANIIAKIPLLVR